MNEDKDKHYNVGNHILTCGRNLVSDHVEHLFNTIAHVNAKDLINMIVFNKNLPEKEFGTFHGASRSMCVNLEAHLAHNLGRIESENPSMSIKALLIMELINTGLHELRHATYKSDANNFSEKETDEEEAICQAFADENMYEVGKYLDLEVQSFGPVIDNQLLALYKDLKEAKETDTFHQWQMSQLNMIEKDILFLDEANDVVIKTMRELCAYFSKTANWEDANIVPHISNCTEPVIASHDRDEYAEATSEPQTADKVDETSYLYHEESDSLFTETSREKADEMIHNGDGCVMEISKERYETLKAIQETAKAAKVDEHTSDGHQPAPVNDGPTIEQFEGMDPFDDCATDIVMPDNLPEMMATPELDNFPSPVEVTTKSANVSPVEPATDQNATVFDIRQTAEMVFRRLFTHLYSKCGYDGKGNFANPSAVIEAVPIDDIAGASTLFKNMDTADGMGVYKPKTEIGAYITGLISESGKLPYYRLYINQGGVLKKRTFIPQNPDKANNGVLTKWAQQVRDGWKITMLLGDNGPTLDMKTKPDELLGQETFNPWPKK